MKPLPQLSVIRSIIQYVGGLYGVTEAQMRGENNQRTFAYPRFVVFWILANEIGMSRAAIGRVFDRDQSTVTHGIPRAEQIFGKDQLALIALRAKSRIDIQASKKRDAVEEYFRALNEVAEAEARLARAEAALL